MNIWLLSWTLAGACLFPFICMMNKRHGRDTVGMNVFTILVCGPACWAVWFLMIVIGAAFTTARETKVIRKDHKTLEECARVLSDIRRDADLPHAHTVLTPTQEAEIDHLLAILPHVPQSNPEA